MVMLSNLKQNAIQPCAWSILYCVYLKLTMTSSNGDILRDNGPLWGESTGHRWIPLTKASDAGLWFFHWSKRLSKQSRRRWFETPSRLLWCDVFQWSCWRYQTTTTYVHVLLNVSEMYSKPDYLRVCYLMPWWRRLPWQIPCHRYYRELLFWAII